MTRRELRLFFRWWFPVLAWAALISFFSTAAFSASNTGSVVEDLLRLLWPGLAPETVSLLHGVVRKAGHVGEYCILSLLLARALRAGGPEWRPRWTWISVSLVAAYAGVDEWHQFRPQPHGQPSDVGFDVAGGFLGQVLRRLRG